MNTNMATATYHPQTGNVKPLTANSSLSFAVKSPPTPQKTRGLNSRGQAGGGGYSPIIVTRWLVGKFQEHP